MTLLLPVAAGAALWYGLAHSYNLKQRASVPIENHSQRSDVKEPFQGAWGSIKQYCNTDTRGRFVSVQEDFDVNGAKIFLVDYGNGARTIQYHDPRVLL